MTETIEARDDDRPHMMSPHEIEQIVRKAIRDELELVGMIATDADRRMEIRKDFEFLRSMRNGTNAALAKVGLAVVTAGAGIVFWLIQSGAIAKFGK